ncbi:27c67025-dfa0-4fd8-b3fe-75abf594af28 [Sclerotinia trifoliorum]|uniref:27c67025-dfa0-4fd8-b3fe-75abf594af28 n=1 Tax=Sclerotinia trifoliorum TaxID=28548 RepID=A0A8H2VVN5_9HELO|nr:27c67025-dfa0-4fd8-b3fe-75abf594af28 [Sclerotinia trifoliorum]
MSNITLQPTGLVDASKRYWAQRIDTTAMLRFKQVTYGLSPDFTSYINFEGGSQYFPRGTRTYNPPPAATTLFANYKTIIDLRLKFEKDVFPTYERLREVFHTYATEAHDHYDQVLNLLGTLRASILATNTHSTADLETLRTIVDARVNLSSRMKDNANYIVELLQGINRSLPACIKNINQSVADLNVFCVFTADEQKKISNPNTINISGFAEKYALVHMGYAVPHGVCSN